MYTLNIPRLIGLIFLYSRLILIVRGSGTATVSNLPPCVTNTSAAACKSSNKGDDTLTTDTICVDSSAKMIYKSTKGESGGCTGQLTSGTAAYKAYTCTDANTCADATTETAILAYYYDGTNLSQIKDKLYYDITNTALFNCESNGVCSKLTTSGYYVNPSEDSKDGATEKPLLSLASGVVTAKAAGDLVAGTYYLDESSKSNDVYTKLIECKGDTVACSIPSSISAGYYINGATTKTLTKALIQCSGSGKTFKCEEKDAEVGTYINNGVDVTAGAESPDTYSNQLINCDSTNGCSGGDPAGPGYLINVADSSRLIYCSATNAACSSVSNGISKKIAASHCIEAAAANAAGVISCTTDGCIKEDTGLKGYFINSKSDSSTNQVISCNGTKCEAIAGESTCASNGGKIKVSGDKVYFCISDADSDTHPEVKIGASKASYNAITLGTPANFPGNSVAGIAVKIGVDGSVILLEGGALPACVASKCVQGVYCLDTVVKTYDTTQSDGTCSAIPDTIGEFIFAKSDGTAITTPTTTDVPDIVYRCEYSSNKASACSLVKGYVTSGSNYVQCSGWKRDECTVKAMSSCAATDIGVLGSGNKLCFGTTEVALPSGTATSGIAFIPEDINTNYGVLKDAPAFLTLTSNSAIINSSATANAKSYQKNYVVNGTKTNALIYCKTNKTDCVTKDATSGYYVNSGGDSTTNQIIKCSSSGCTGESVSATSCSKSGDIINNSGIKLCTSDSDSKAFAGTTADSYETLELESDDDFPDGKKGKIGVKIVSDGTNAVAALLLEEASLPECTSTKSSAVCYTGAVDNQVCIKEGKLYKTASSKCSQITRTSGNKGDKEFSYYSEDYKEIAVGDLAATKLPSFTYECSLDSGKKLENCKIVKGYTNIAASAVKCNGWKEVCEVSPKAATCSSDGDGLFATSILCIDGTNDITLPTTTTNEKVAFTLKDTSGAYGLLKDDIVLLSISSTQAVVNSTLGEGTRYFMNHNGATEEENEIIKCEGENCDVEVNNVGYYIDYGTEATTTTGTGDTAVTKTTYSRLISCPSSDTVCTSVPTPSPNYYIDASSAEPEERTETDSEGEEVNVQYYTKLIYCDTNNKCEPVEEPKPGYYISATPDSTKLLTDALIECSEEPIGCKIITALENTIYINNTEGGMLIQCSDDTTNGCKAFAGTGTADVPVFYMNAATSSLEDEEYSNHIIKCSNTACEKISGIKDGIYLNGNLKGITGSASTDENQLIKCIDGKCEGLPASVDGSYYLNAGKYTISSSSKSYPLIKCSGTTIKCEASEVILGKGNPTDVFYINGDYDPSEPGDKKYLIKCTALDSCEFYGETKEEVVEHYIHGAQSSADDAIIECTIGVIDEDEEIFGATCAFIQTAPVKDNLYINSADKNLIQCYGSTVACGVFKGALGSSEVPSYFINAAADTSEDEFKGFLIKCTGEGTCEEADGIDNGIFINGNFKDSTVTTDNPNPNGDTAKRLISCTEDDNCIGIAGTAGSYYVNSGSIIKKSEERKREDSAYKNSLIICPSTKTSPCTPTDGGEDYVYLNGNQDVDSNYLIVCNSGTCISIEGLNADEIDYYINSGHSDDNVLKDSIISCDDSECKVLDLSKKITATVTELFFLNKNYGLDEDNNEKDMVNYLIKCTSSGCIPYGTPNPKDGDVEHYINGAGTDLTDTVIEISFSPLVVDDEDSQGGARKRDEDIIIGTIKLIKADENDIYINSSNGKLIQCDKSKCTNFQSTGTANVPAYYINSSKESDDNYEGLIIKCTNEKCILEEGVKANNVYINANLKDTTDGATENPIKNTASTDTNPLIICSSSACTSTVSQATTDKDEYYLNAGEYSDGTNTLKLIRCINQSSVTCAAEKVELGSASELFYINSNYDPDRDSENYLIKCTSSTECEATKNEKPEVGNEHYVHGSPDTENPLKNAIIECKMEEAGASGSRRKREEVENNEEEEEEDSTSFKATCELLEDAKENNIYINSSDPKQVIRCISTGCTTANNESTDKSSGYYINVDKEGTNNLIKCIKEECKIITTEELKKIEGKKVFVNANYLENADKEKPLIKCDNAGTCSLDISSATEEDPEFYINADKDKENKDYDGALNTDIIKCTFNGEESKLKVYCNPKALTAKVGDVFLNSDFEESTNVKQIIKCTSEGCVEAAAYGEEDDSTSRKYFINAGSNDPEDKLQDTLIECSDPAKKCKIKPAKPEGIYINSVTDELIICSDESNGCKATASKPSKDKYQYFLNSSNLEYNPEEYIEYDLIKCFIGKDGKNKCVPESGEDKKVYINSNNPSQVIYCLSGALCKVKDSTAQPNSPQYFVNGDTIDFESENSEEGSNETVNKRKRKREESNEQETTAKDSDPLGYDLIKCSVKGGTTIVCDVANGEDGNVYINGNYDASGSEGDSVNHLIKCSEEKGCIAVPSNVSDEKLPEYYINSGNEGKDKFNAALIQCIKSGSEITCDTHKAEAYQIYRNDNENQMETMPLIKCSKNSCNKASSGATKDSKEYYLNSGNIDDTPKNYDIIECAVEDNKSRKRASESSSIVVCTCKTKDDTGDGVYINSNYSESGDNNQLIKCSKDNGCEGIKSESTNKIMEYYVNAESEGLSNAIIFCANKKCEKQSPSDIPTYYVGKDEDNVNGLIECVQSTITNEEQSDDTVQNTDVSGETSQTQRKRKRSSESTVKKCTLKPAFSSQGYYLNSGYNKATNQTILCDSTDGCSTLKVDLGYYVNAGNTDKPIIKCEKEGNECTEEESPDCPESKDAKAGNYCFADNQLKFYPSSNSTAISASKSDDCYSFATIPVNGFPGIRTETGSLFKISRYYINRYYQSGVVMIDKNGKLVDTLTSDQSDISLYDCNDSTKICSERPGCTSNTYMFDSENKKAVFCNSGKMEYAQISGYVVDGTRVTGGSKHPYIIYCESNGEKCQSFKPKLSTYYENSGYDSSTYSLIQCSNNNCVTVTAEAGYYVGHGENGNSGIIKCTSSTTCTYSQIKSKVKYVNAGSDKTSYAIIECTKTNGCSVSKARTGYYLTYTSTLLIQCTSPTSCTEFTPTVNYYDNADSSESSSTIINCVQNSSVVTCATEATNNGFYLSSLSNVLIRCKAGSKCKTITVKNGIFRGALKGLTSNSKRSEDENEVVNEKKVREQIDDNLEEDGKMVNLRDSDDAYGIIRCVAGKCGALSPTELAAIPMCEFNNNKCYITLEYAMTKSATTSISAGNICTNSDRSVFYFATDTIVVKPNVISGVTATYIYTTTNSNCLEVNDSYDDMYFTVGSNIYMLDQGSVLQFYEIGYYFLNVAKNTLVNGNDIDAYNDENVKLYRCNGSSCSIVDKPESMTYYADVNKRILKYNVNSDAYSFAYERDITCIFANNKCTPNADLKNQEFCITYKGELVLATTDIKNRETGECYRASSISSTIYGYSQYLYNMNQFAAQMVDQTGYYIISLSTNTTVVSKNYKTKNNSLVVYGCTLSSCKVYEPDEDTYYYDAQAKTILRYRDGVWNTPSTSGYAYISIDPTNTYIYKFSKSVDDIKIQSIANYGYYYTVDNEMYHCDQDEDGACTPIDETGYYFTNSGEIYYCIHDSEELEATECTKQACISGQYYFIDDAYYRCEVSSLLVPVVSRYCSYDDNVIINFPLALTEEFPDKIKQAVEGIQKNNNSTAIVSRRGKNYLEAVSGIFTNCTYNVEETKSTFDLVCVNNFVTVDKESDEVKICSIEQLGYIECIEDEDNPEKCNVSAANVLLKPSLFVFISYLLVALFFNF